MIDDLDEDFTRDFMMWLFNKPIKKGDLIIKGLTPHSVSRRFVYLHTFSKWYSRVTKEYIKIESPNELRNGM